LVAFDNKFANKQITNKQNTNANKQRQKQFEQSEPNKIILIHKKKFS